MPEVPENPHARKMRPGVYHLPQDSSCPQNLFLQSVRRCAPAVLEALEREVLPVCDLCTSGKYLAWAAMRSLWGYDPLAKLPAPDEVRAGRERAHVATFEPIWRWAERFHLVAPRPHPNEAAVDLRWRDYHLGVVGLAYRTLQEWAQTAAPRSALGWAVLPRSAPLGSEAEAALAASPLAVPDEEQWDIDEYLERRAREGARFIFVCSSFDHVPTHEVYAFNYRVPRWNPLLETRAEARARLAADFEARLNEKLDKEQQLAERMGAEPWPHRVEAMHFDWLALYQVLGLSYQRVAGRCHRARQTATAGVKGAAQAMIGDRWKHWLRPPGQPGRPRRS